MADAGQAEVELGKPIQIDTGICTKTNRTRVPKERHTDHDMSDNVGEGGDKGQSGK